MKVTLKNVKENVVTLEIIIPAKEADNAYNTYNHFSAFKRKNR